MDADQELFVRAAEEAARHRATVAGRPVHPRPDRSAMAAAFGGALPTAPTTPDRVLEDLVTAASPGIVGTVGPRFFGFVIGGASPAAPAAGIPSPRWGPGAATPRRSRG